MAADTTRTSDGRDLTLDADGAIGALVPGTVLGRYEIVAPIGAGGMGVVYRARDPALGRDLAIKVVPSRRGRDGQARLLREAQAMARVRRAGVVPVFDVGELGDGVFVVMPFLPGGTLGQWLAAAPRRWREVLDRFVAAGRGLAVAHAAGLVHRDFKPDNVLLDEHGELAVADFGLARTADELSADRSIVGTPAYMPPEQLRGEAVDARADVFAFCASLYEGLYGERAFASTQEDVRDRIAALLDAIVAGRVRPAPAGTRIPAWLRAAIVRGLAADPEDRWPSIDALLAHVARRRSRPRRIALAAGIAIALAAAVAVVIATRGHADAPAAPVAHATHRLTTSGDIARASVSPDSRHVAAVAGTDLVAFDVDHPEARRTLAHGLVLMSPDTFRVSWSPDSREIIYPLSDPRTTVVWHAITLAGADRVLPAQQVGITLARDGRALGWAEDGHAITIYDASGRVGAPCAIDGAYEWLVGVLASRVSDDVFVTTVGTDTRYQIYRTDLRCARVERILSGRPIHSLAPSADGAGFVATETVGDHVEVVAIDRDGRESPLGISAHSDDAVAGARADGSVVVIDGAATWRLVRVDRAAHTTDLAAGSNRVALAVSRDGTRLAIADYGDHGTLRTGLLAHPDALGPVLARGALALDWSFDSSRLAAITTEGGVDHLVLVDADGGHRSERVLDDASAASELIVRWIGPDQLAYELAGNIGYAVLDLRTGARHDLIDRHTGWAYALHSSASGALAWIWNRRGDAAIWYAPHDGTPARRIADDSDADHAPLWSGDDLLLITAGSPAISRVDLATGALSPYLSLPFEYGVENGNVFALPGGDLLVERTTSIRDLELVTPVR